jgi:hypothetical protein
MTRKARLLNSCFAICLMGLFCSHDALGQAGVCNRATDDAKQKMNDDYAAWVSAIQGNGLPQEVQNAYIVLFKYNKNQSYAQADLINQDCTRSFKTYQDVMDAIVTVYTLGLAKVLQPAMTHVDVSELLKGYTLGGPNALVPKFREQILRGDNGTVANIVRDPWKCLSFQRKC